MGVIDVKYDEGEFLRVWDMLDGDSQESILNKYEDEVKDKYYYSSLYSDACDELGIEKSEIILNKEDNTKNKAEFRRINFSGFSVELMESTWFLFSKEEREEMLDSVDFDGKKDYDIFLRKLFGEMKKKSFKKI